MLQVMNHFFFKYYIIKISFYKFYLTSKRWPLFFHPNRRILPIFTMNYLENFMSVMIWWHSFVIRKIFLKDLDKKNDVKLP